MPSGEIAVTKAVLIYGPLVCPGVNVKLINIVPDARGAKLPEPVNKFLSPDPLNPLFILKRVLVTLLTEYDVDPAKVAFRSSSTCTEDNVNKLLFSTKRE